MNIYTLMPLYKFMDAPCVQKLIAMICDIFQSGDHFNIVFTQGENICLARNSMMRHVVGLIKQGTSIDYILCLDSDHEYSATAMYTLIDKIRRHKLPALSSSYYCRGNRNFSMLREKDGKYHNVTPTTLGKGIQECDVFGFGFVVFRADTIVKLIENHHAPFQMNGDTYTGEDYYFCELMKEEGFQPYYDADTIVGHYTAFFNK